MFWTLVKTFLHENFALRRLLGMNVQKQKTKAIAIVLVILFALGSFAVSFGYLFMNLAMILDQSGLVEVMLMYLFFYMSMLSLLTALFRANGYLFNYKDYQILEPLPIHPRVVLAAKATVLLIMNYFSIFIFTAPIAFAYFYYHFTVVGILMYLLMFAFVPMIPIIVMSFISLLIARITAGMRNTKFLTLILLVAVTIGFMYLQISYSASMTNPFLNQQGFIAGLGDVYLPMMFYAQAIHQGNILSFLAFIGISAVPFGLFLYLISGMVRKTNQKGMSVVTKKNTKIHVYSRRTVVQAMIQKEFKKYFNSIMYAMNTGIGIIFMLIIGVGSLFFQSSLETMFAQYAGLGIGFEVIVLIALAFCIAMVYTPAISTSLEGKNFWILKSLPISPNTIMKSKVLFNVVLVLPVALISAIMAGIGFHLSIVTIMAMLIFIVVLSFLTSTFDMILNLYFPKMEFVNDQEVVKQSLAALIALFGNMFFMILDGVLVYLLMNTFDMAMNLLIASVFNCLIFAGFVFLLKKVGAKLLLRM